MALQFRHLFCPFVIRNRVTDAPAGHRVGFGKRTGDANESAQIFRQSGGRENFRRRLSEKQITFVGQNINISLGTNFDDFYHLGFRNDATRRIVRRIDD